MVFVCFVAWSLAGAAEIRMAPYAFAVQPDEILDDPKLEKRARAISAELRCLVCQNESIDDSNAPLARDLRLLVRERIKGGDSDADVMRFVVARYGSYVLLRPPFNSGTLLLWLSPILVLCLAGFLVLRLFRTDATAAESGPPVFEPLSENEKSRLDDYLKQHDEDRNQDR